MASLPGSSSRSAAARWLAAVALAATLAPHLMHCARAQCQRNSDCPTRQSCTDFTCVSECGADRDCPSARPLCNENGRCVAPTDAAGPGPDATRSDAAPPDAPPDVPPPDAPISLDAPSPVDVPAPPPDAPAPPPDAPVPPPDVPASGTRAYLDACARDEDCASGACAPGAPRFCTRACTASGDCAAGQICAAGRCRLDDAGTPGCDPASGAPCLQYCYGSATAAHCTHDCATAADCPAGFACSPVVGGRRVCVDIERPCVTAAQCPSGLGFCGAGGAGCTADCNSAADCPERLVGLPPYTCEMRSGRSVCVPPADVLGSDPLGAACSATGTNQCRSGACDDGVAPPMCNQRCTVRGGCPRGFGCAPVPEGADVLLVCNRAGSGWLGDACGRGAECLTGLCQIPGYCTRLCSDDGACPTGMFCRDTGLRATDGTSVRLCSR